LPVRRRNSRLQPFDAAAALSRVWLLQRTINIRVFGEGRKERCLPLWKETTADLRAWLAMRGVVPVPELFVNADGASRPDQFKPSQFHRFALQQIFTFSAATFLVASYHPYVFLATGLCVSVSRPCSGRFRFSPADTVHRHADQLEKSVQFRSPSHVDRSCDTCRRHRQSYVLLRYRRARGFSVTAGQAVLSSPLLPFGPQSLYAYYSGNASFAPSKSSLLKQTVNASAGYGFQLPVTYPVIANTVATGDFNGDGIPDLALASDETNNATVLLGKGDGTFQPAIAFPVGGNPVSIVAGDFNGDGRQDLVVVGRSILLSVCS
jgi:hypothetical protein